MQLQYSFVIPVFNRPQEIKELLESFVVMEFEDPYEIVIVEDGSSETSESIVNQYSSKLNISYYFKPNSGPGDSRNYGMGKAKGNYFIILDSDVLLPPHYLKTVDSYLKESYTDCYGGADAADDRFSPLQRAINYVMTSYLTTGGIRGNTHSISKFEPRSFNMGISKAAFLKTGGYSKIHPGEDPDLSNRIKNKGFETQFIPNAQVYHKRRISWGKFYTQVKKFGLVRPILNRWHPSSARITYWFPSLFVLFVLLSVVGAIVYNWICIIPLSFYLLIIFIHATLLNSSLLIGALAVKALFYQFFGYGLAFLKSSFYVGLLKKDPEQQFPNLFFK